MNIEKAIDILKKNVPKPEEGLPDPLFYYVSTVTPYVNVDLLIKDENGRTLLSWRNDKYTGQGWHVPGGIVRFRETFEERINKVAQTEVGALVKFDQKPIAINQIIIRDHPIRSHFISILFKCSLPSSFIPKNNGISINDPGYLMWHDNCPDDLLIYHNIYKKFINKT